MNGQSKCLKQLNVYGPDMKSYIYIQRSATGTNLPSPSPTKLLLCCTIFSFQLSRQPVFSGALLQIPTPAKTHTTAHFPPAKNSPMRGDAHSGKHSERNTVYELEITTMNAALAPSFFILGADVRRFTEASYEKSEGTQTGL